MLLSLVIPCYNEEGNVRRFYDAVNNCFCAREFDYELLFIDDGSRDGTFAEIKSLGAGDSRIRAVSFSRNFGKEAAMYAGLKESCGDLVAIIDADLQQRPEVVLEMLDTMEGDGSIDCVAAYQTKRREKIGMSAAKRGFYKLINKMSDVDFVNGASDFRLMKRSMVDALISMSEYSRFSKGLFGYVGFNTKFIPYTADKREVGKTKWSRKKLTRYALDGIFSFSTAPLKLSTHVGILSAIASLLYLVAVIIQKLAFGIDVPGYATIVVLVLFLGGIQLFSLGIIGEYIGKIFLEVKGRPIYIIREKLDTVSGVAEKNYARSDSDDNSEKA